MKLLLTEAIQKVDDKAIRSVGLPELVLMENAGRAVADAANVALEGAEGKRIVIFVGKGNNGGDGLVAARLLENLGAFVYVVLLNNAEEIVGSAAQELRILASCCTEVISWEALEKKRSKVFSLCAGADLFIDAMLGTGFKGELTGSYLRATELMEQLPVPALAVDIPSGVEANTGHVASTAVHVIAIFVACLISLGEFIAIKRTKMCGWPKYPNPQAKREIMLIMLKLLSVASVNMLK